MRVLYVVQRYGDRIVGGSEAACRAFAEQLVRHGHSVEVLTSCAHNYTDWADEYTPGVEWINGVVVNRLPVVRERDDRTFGRVHAHMMGDPPSVPYSEQLRWARLMGPELKGSRAWLSTNCTRFDVAVFMTYLYATATSGLPVVAGRIPTVLQPTAHDEPPAYVPLYQTLFRLPDSFMFFTHEEREVVRRIYGFEPVGEVTGIGIEQKSVSGDPARFRAAFGLGDHPYLLYVGRLDPSKGVGELLRFFRAYKTRNRSDLRLVFVGDGDVPMPDDADVVKTGFVDEQVKHDALAGSLALVQPSYFESFSIVLCESWVQGRPALVQAGCSVLDGQARRSGGAIPYGGFAEFEAAVGMLLEQPGLADELGARGREYVATNYTWGTVTGLVEGVLDSARSRFTDRRFVSVRGRGINIANP